jgi:hypothetical protein
VFVAGERGAVGVRFTRLHRESAAAIDRFIDQTMVGTPPRERQSRGW